MAGWCGRALEFDLASGRSIPVPLAPPILQTTLGGRGLAGFLLHTRIPDPSEPAFCLAVGPLCNAGVPTAERLAAVFRSPLSRGLCCLSAGNRFAAALKGTGFDALLVRGRAPRLSLLNIDAKGAAPLSATHLGGILTDHCFAVLSQGGVLVSGPAADAGLPFASVVADQGEGLSRGGLGALWARMNLKALVASGALRKGVADPAGFARALADFQRLSLASPYLHGPLGIGACGTPALLDLTQARQMLPSENFRHTAFAEAAQVSAAQLKRLPGYAPNPCPGCDIGCRKQASGGELPEYDELAHFSALLGNGSLAAAVAADRRCRALGLDPLCAALELAALADSARDSSAQELVDRLDRLVESGGGEFPRSAMRCKGLDLPAFDPRGAYGLALSLAVSTCTDYMQARAHFHELLRKPVPTERFSFAGKARMIQQAEDATAAADSLAVCRHTLIAAGLEEFATLLSMVSGVKFDAAALSEVGRATVLRERWINQQAGITAEDEMLPALFFEQAGSREGDLRIEPLDRSAFLAERARYYRLRGLDQQGRLGAPPQEPG